jgi:hypothetical protein
MLFCHQCSWQSTGPVFLFGHQFNKPGELFTSEFHWLLYLLESNCKSILLTAERNIRQWRDSTHSQQSKCTLWQTRDFCISILDSASAPLPNTWRPVRSWSGEPALKLWLHSVEVERRSAYGTALEVSTPNQIQLKIQKVTWTGWPAWPAAHWRWNSENMKTRPTSWAGRITPEISPTAAEAWAEAEAGLIPPHERHPDVIDCWSRSNAGCLSTTSRCVNFLPWNFSFNCFNCCPVGSSRTEKRSRLLNSPLILLSYSLGIFDSYVTTWWLFVQNRS